MSLKIRLQKRGRKKNAIYPVVVSDVKSPRDGKFIEKIGLYNPNINPSLIVINFDRTIYWIKQGALCTDTTKSILSKKGIFLKIHLLKGVKKGAFNLNEAENRFKIWIEKNKK